MNLKTNFCLCILFKEKKMEDLKFASEEEAIQHLANLTGKSIKVAKGKEPMVKCPTCKGKVMKKSGYCMKCQAPIDEMKGGKKDEE